MRIISLNVGRPAAVSRNGRQYSTAIDRCPVRGSVHLGPSGLAGDEVADKTNHGGPEQAVCCYPYEHYDLWRQRLACELSAPSFGENVTSSGLLEVDVAIGDVYRLGGATVQVSQPRGPCSKLVDKHGHPKLAQWIKELAYTGFYFRVLEPGDVSAGDEIVLLERPRAGLTVEATSHARHSRSPDPALLRQLAGLAPLAAGWRDHFAKRLALLAE